MAFAVLRLGWNASLFGVALLLTIAFSTADWLVAQDATAARLGYERIALGPAYACIDYAPPLTGQACGAYGWNLADIPHSTWRVGAFFLGVSLLLLWLVWILSLFSFIFPRLHRAAACFVGIAACLAISGLLTLAGGLAEASNDSSSLSERSLFAPCVNSSMFNTGRCAIQSSAIIALVATVLMVAVTGYGLMLHPERLIKKKLFE